MKTHLTRKPLMLKIVVAVLIGAVLLLLASYIAARREADHRVVLSKDYLMFYRQYLLIHYISLQTNWSGPAWEVRYEKDELSGFTRDVRVSLFGNYIDCNFLELAPKTGVNNQK